MLGGIGGTASLLVHEFGHVRVARSLGGIQSARVSLVWLGAATRIEGAYATGKEQSRVAIAGPRASFEFACSIAALTALPMPLEFRKALLLLALLNVAIGVLNLVPAYPMDGYKLVHGLLWSATGSEHKAQQALGRVGHVAFLVGPAVMTALVIAKPNIGVGASFMAGTLVAQKRLMRSSCRARTRGSRSSAPATSDAQPERPGVASSP